MIILPTRRRLERRREALYEQLSSALQHATICQVESVMRRIHIINLKLKTYFAREHQPKEVFDDEEL